MHSVPGSDEDECNREQGRPGQGGDDSGGRRISGVLVDALTEADERYQNSKNRQISPRQSPGGREQRQRAAHDHENDQVGGHQLTKRESIDASLRGEVLRWGSRLVCLEVISSIALAGRFGGGVAGGGEPGRRYYRRPKESCGHIATGDLWPNVP